AETTRLTTNFANVARGDTRQENLRNALQMMNNRLNALAHWDNPTADRYRIDLEIISAEARLEGSPASGPIPLIEMLKTTILDRQSNTRLDRMVGNSFSSYVREYDFR